MKSDERKRSLMKVNGQIKFLLLVLGLYLLVALINPVVSLNALQHFFGMLTKVLPILVIVFIVLLLTNLFLNPARINKHLGADSGFRGWLYAIVGGIFISGPPYILYPMLGELKKNGARNGLLAAMLYNRNVKIYFFPAIIYYFSLPYAVVLSIYIILFSLLNGKLLEFFVNKHESQ
ncbi:MAG: hypothetical protein KAS94_10020 [Desulfobulbaceae bacterium]|nr:hypothetical protein [Desulfobulbaceae bacterium]